MNARKGVLSLALFLTIVGIVLFEIPHNETEMYVAMVSIWIGLGLISMESLNAYESWSGRKAQG